MSKNVQNSSVVSHFKTMFSTFDGIFIVYKSIDHRKLHSICLKLQCKINLQCGQSHLGGFRGSRVGVVVRDLASHQCGLCLIPRLSVTCGLSLLLVLFLAPRVLFFSGYSGFPLSSKTNISKFQFDLKSVHNYYSALNTTDTR